MEKKIRTNLLDHINTGLYSDLSLDQIQTNFPDMYKKWKTDTFHFRYPEGESFADLVHRLDPFILQLERLVDPILVIAHETVIKILYCYFVRSKEVFTAPSIPIPKYSIIELASTPSGWTEKIYTLLKLV